MAYRITEKCISCGACAAECPVGCISQGEERFVIDLVYHVELVQEFVLLKHQLKNNKE